MTWNDGSLWPWHSAALILSQNIHSSPGYKYIWFYHSRKEKMLTGSNSAFTLLFLLLRESFFYTLDKKGYDAFIRYCCETFEEYQSIPGTTQDIFMVLLSAQHSQSLSTALKPQLVRRTELACMELHKLLNSGGDLGKQKKKKFRAKNDWMSNRDSISIRVDSI